MISKISPKGSRDCRKAGYLPVNELSRLCVGVVEYGPTFKTANLSREPPTSGSDIINEPLVGTAGLRILGAHASSGFTNCLGIHGFPRLRPKGNSSYQV